MSDEESVSGRRSDDTSMPVVLHRLDAIEHRLDQNAKDTARGFADVRAQIAGLAFVRTDVYAANQETAGQIHRELAKDIVDGDAALEKKLDNLTVQMKLVWTVVGGTVIAGLIGVLFQIAGRT